MSFTTHAIGLAEAPASRIATTLAAQRDRLFLWLPVCMGLGVLLYFSLTEEPPGWWGAAIVLPALAAGLLLKPGLARWAVFGIAAAGAGFAACEWRTMQAPPTAPLPTRGVIVEGQVIGVDLLAGGRRIAIEAPRLDGAPPLDRTLRVRLRTDDATPLAVGDRVSIRARLLAPPWPTYPGAADFQRKAFFDGIAGSGFALGPARIVGRETVDRFGLMMRALRDRVVTRILAALPGAEGGIAAALLTGVVTAIPEADLVAFRDSGLAHLLSVSGLHMAIVVGLVMASVRLGLALAETPALRLPSKQIAALAALAGGGLYLLLTGAQVPTLRSYLMAAVVMVGVMSGRPAITLRSLALAALVVLATTPEELVGPSFQMSFAAVLALIAGWEAMRLRLTALRTHSGLAGRIGLYLAGMALTSVLAGLATAPFAAYHFERAQLWSVAANMAALPLASVLVMPAGVLALLLMPFGLESLALAPMGWGITATLWIAHGVAAWPYAAVNVPVMPNWGILCITGGMLVLALWRGRLRQAGIPLLLAGAVAPWTAAPPVAAVTQDARMIVLAGVEGPLLLRQTGASRFAQDQLGRLFRENPLAPLACEDAACRLQGSAVLLVRAPQRRMACGNAVLVVSPEPLRGACRGKPAIDRFDVWRNGAHAAWVAADGTVRIVSDRARRGARPWVPPVPQPRARRTAEARAAE